MRKYPLAILLLIIVTITFHSLSDDNEDTIINSQNYDSSMLSAKNAQAMELSTYGNSEENIILAVEIKNNLTTHRGHSLEELFFHEDFLSENFISLNLDITYDLVVYFQEHHKMSDLQSKNNKSTNDFMAELMNFINILQSTNPKTKKEEFIPEYLPTLHGQLHKLNYFDLQEIAIELAGFITIYGDDEAREISIGLSALALRRNGYEGDIKYYINDRTLKEGYTPKNSKYIKISLSGCYGTCPIYIMYIYEARFVDYLGIDFVPKTGLRSAILNNDLFGIIKTKVLNHINNGHPLRDPNFCGPTDGSNIYITLHGNTLRRPISLSHYDSCGRDVEAQEILINEIHSILPFKELKLDQYDEFDFIPVIHSIFKE